MPLSESKMTSNHNIKQEYERLQEIENKLDKHLNEKDNKSIKVELLHEFNDVKDAAQVAIGYIARVEGGTVGAVHARLNLTD